MWSPDMSIYETRAAQHAFVGTPACLLSLFATFTQDQMVPKLGFDRLRSHLSHLQSKHLLDLDRAW